MNWGEVLWEVNEAVYVKHLGQYQAHRWGLGCLVYSLFLISFLFFVILISMCSFHLLLDF